MPTNRPLFQKDPSKEEVLAAVERTSVMTSPVWVGGHIDTSKPGEKKAVGRSANDIAEAIYTKAHGFSCTSGVYEARSAALRKGVNVSAVKRHLSALAEEGAIVAVPGSHWSMKGNRGTMEKATYYFSKQATEIAEKREGASLREKQEKAARQRAERKVLDLHKDEVEKFARTYLRETVKPSLGWPVGKATFPTGSVPYRVQGGSVEEI